MHLPCQCLRRQNENIHSQINLTVRDFELMLLHLIFVVTVYLLEVIIINTFLCFGNSGLQAGRFLLIALSVFLLGNRKN